MLTTMNVTPLNRRTAQTLRERVAEEVRAELGRAGISVNAAAKALGWSQPYLQRRVSGTTAFDVDDLERLCTWLRVPLEQLLGAGHPTAAHGDIRQVTVRYGAPNGATIIPFPLATGPGRRYRNRQSHEPIGPITARQKTGNPTTFIGHSGGRVSRATAAV